MEQFTTALLVLALDILQGKHPSRPRWGMGEGTSISYAAAIQEA